MACPDVLSFDEVNHHLQVALRLPGRKTLTVGARLKLIEAMVSVRELDRGDRPAGAPQFCETTHRLKARRGVVLAAEDPKLRRSKVLQHRHRVVLSEPLR